VFSLYGTSLERGRQGTEEELQKRRTIYVWIERERAREREREK
jgi:hypothetical protein